MIYVCEAKRVNPMTFCNNIGRVYKIVVSQIHVTLIHFLILNYLLIAIHFHKINHNQMSYRNFVFVTSVTTSELYHKISLNLTLTLILNKVKYLFL